MTKELIHKIINDIDTEDLGETMLGKAESLQMEYGGNIVIFEISLEELRKGNFYNMEKMSTIEYGDWDSLRNWVSESEVERIKKQFDEDLEDLSNDDSYEVDDCSQIYSSFLYCNGEYVWGALVA